jgi:uncharacterized surface protein with fasciclin (FAS1) repeats
MKKVLLNLNKKKVVGFTVALFCSSGFYAQTSAFDVIAASPNHTYLETALIQEGLDVALDNSSATLTVFAPDDNAFTNIATALGTNINGLLALPNLSDILSYHVLGSEVASSAITNGAIVQPLSPTNTLKLTLKANGDVFVNQAQVTTANINADNGIVHVLNAVVLPSETVVDVAIDNGFTSLTAAVVKAELLPALTNPLATLTVFAPTNTAFDNIATGLGVTVTDLLNLPNLADILTYHVLGTEVASSAITNGAIVQPLSTTNTLKLTLKANGDVFVNQAQVTAANINADNGIVHVLNAVVLPSETVVDVAIDNGFTSLTAAVVKAELLPALTNPLATLTVFAPTNTAFDNIATGLGVTVADLLNLPNLADILTYHVLGTEVASSAITNGAIVQPLSTTNTLKLTLKTNGDVFVNQAQVTTANINADNGIVHVLNAVVLPSETVVDVAIDNGFTSLTAAVVKAELLPALTNPLATLTVFAPTNTAFNDLATALGTDLAGVLASPNLTEILTYHVLATEVTSTQLVNNSNVPTLNGQTVLVTTTPTVKINESNVTLADVQAQNGVVHVIDAVLLPGFADINEVSIADLNFYPNPATENISIDNFTTGNYQILNSLGQMVKSGKIENNLISVLDLESGSYIVRFTNEEGNFQGKLIKQ